VPDASASRHCLLLSTAANFGGMERVVCGLSRQLVGRGWQTQTLFPLLPDHERFVSWCTTQGVHAGVNPAVLDAAYPHRIEDMFALRRLVRDACPDVVNIHYGSNFISFKDLLALRTAGVPDGVPGIVASVHMSVDWSILGSRKRRMTRLASELCDAVVAVSGAAREILLEAGVRESKLHVIPPGVPIPSRQPDRREARALLGLSPDAFVVASVARLIPRKGIGDLIDALGLLSPNSGHPVELVIAGDGPERQALQERARRHLGSRARFAGFMDDVAPVYAAADVFVLPSYLEGLPLVYVEAAYQGIPSIGADTGDVGEIVRDQETGLLVPPGDPRGLADAIETLRHNPALRRQLGDAARARALAESTEAVMAQRYDALYSEIRSAHERSSAAV